MKRVNISCCLCLVYVLGVMSKSCLFLVYVLSLSYLFLVNVLTMSCLCLVYVLSLSYLFLVYVLTMSCLCLDYVLSITCLSLVYVFSIPLYYPKQFLIPPPPLGHNMTIHYDRRRYFSQLRSYFQVCDPPPHLFNIIWPHILFGVVTYKNFTNRVIYGVWSYSWFHKKGTFSVHSFNDDALSIPERPGS